MNLDDRELRSALARLADDSDPAADIAATVRERLHRRDRLRRTLTIGSLAAAVVATITVASLTVASVGGAPGPSSPAPIGAAPSQTAPPPTVSTPAATGPSNPSASTLPASTPSASTLPASTLPASTLPASTPPASSGATASSSAAQAPPGPSTTPDGERIDQVFVSCYATPDISDPEFRNYLGVTMAGGTGSAAEAVDSCTRFWTEGTLDRQPPYVVDQPSNPSNPVVPELTPCVHEIPATPGDPEVPTHEIVVLPADPGICQRLGLEVPSA